MKRMIIAALASPLAFATPTHAQDWPTRPITMVVPFAAGGAVDVLARLYAPHMSEALGQQVIIENVTGAGGVTGSLRVARAAPNGYQFVLGSAGTHAQNQAFYKNPPYNPITDFEPVILAAEQSLVVIARNSLPAANLQEFIAYARANHAKMQYGSAGTGSGTHLGCVKFNAAMGVEITHVPYRGGAPAMQDLIAGRIDYQCAVSTTAIPQVEAHAVKPIAVLTRARSPSLPNVASAHEQGLTDFDDPFWFALFAPKGTPASIVHKLNRAAAATMDIGSVQEQFKKIGATVVPSAHRSEDYLGTFVASEINKWTAAMKAAGVAAN